MTGEQQEAVCGTCGERLIWSAITQTWRHAVYPGHMPDVRTATIPAPSVPSDERCSTCDRREREDCPQCEFDIHREAPGIGACQKHHPFSYPPTPSQDAEGDHEIEGFHWIDTECCVTCDEPVVHIEGRGWVHLSRVESAIREPYEALVKAARMLKQLHVPFDSEDGRTMERAEAWGALTAALTNIEESQGGRS